MNKKERTICPITQIRLSSQIDNQTQASMKIKIIVALLIIIAIIAGIAAFGHYIIKGKQVSIDETVYIHIYPYDTAESIIEKIEEAAHPTTMLGFKILAKHNNLNKQKKTGRYAIYDGDNMHALYRRIVSNQQTPLMVTIPPTRTIEQLIATVSKQLMLDSTSLANIAMNHLYYERVGYTATSLPSLFIPNSYELYWNISPERFMARMLREHDIFWNDKRKAKAKSIGLTIEEVATLASIVDEETNNNAEKPIVAGLYINRLKRGMPLQADPTVKYALGDFTRKRILKKDLETESPYNTYKHKGLPPGPIRIPTIQAIESVLNHAKHNYLYMCAKEDFSGTHNFATTLAQHNANAQRYQQALNKLKIKK